MCSSCVSVNDPSFSPDGFAVDQVISRYNGQGGEKALEPWQGEPTGDDCLGLGDENSVSVSLSKHQVGRCPGFPILEVLLVCFV